MKPNKKPLLLLLLVLACVVLLVSGTFAAYTNVESIKRVVATRKGVNENRRFSSNYLSDNPNRDSFPLRLISIDENSQNISFGVTVCNYLQNDRTLVNENNVTYTLTARLIAPDGSPITDESQITYTKKDGGSVTLTGAQVRQSVTISDTTYSDGKFTANRTLYADVAFEHVYRVACDDYDLLRSISIQIEALPTDTNVAPRLAGLLKFSAAVAQTTDWGGGFIGPADADAFNYELSGSAQGTLTLTWDSSLIINPSFQAEVNGTIGTGAGGNTHSITFSVGGPGQPNHYRVQFYKATDPCTKSVAYQFKAADSESGTIPES